MDVRTVRDSDAATVISALLLCLIKSYFDIWNSASRASLTSSKEINFLLSISTTLSAYLTVLLITERALTWYDVGSI